MIQHQQHKRGQALVEYALILMLIIGIWTGINTVIKKGIKDMWKEMAKQVAAGCPTCTPPESIQ